jgi:putative ABC transport system substrate-binding protein
MRDLGYVEGTHFTVEARFADGKFERLPALAAELVGMKVDVIVTGGGPAVRAVYHATKNVPIVVTALTDPVSDGFVASLARPGGNMTGLTTTAADLGPKHLDLLKAATPKLSRVAVLLQPGNPGHPRQFVGIFSAAQKVGIQVVLAEAGTVGDIERASATMTKERAQAVIVLSDNFFNEESQLIAAQAMKRRLASVSGSREFTEAGGLMSYGANIADNHRRAATYVDKILKGAKPGDLPFEQPTRYSLVINGKTAKSLGLTIPPALLQQAEEVIQ